MQYTSMQAHSGAVNQNQIKFNSRDYRVGSQFRQSCENFEYRIASRLYPPWNRPEPKLLKAQIWKLGHSLSDRVSLLRLHKCLPRGLGVLPSVHFWFCFIFFSSALPRGRKCDSHLERNPLLCHGPARGWVLPKNARQSYDPTWINSALIFGTPAPLLCTQISLESKQHSAKASATCSCS